MNRRTMRNIAVLVFTALFAISAAACGGSKTQEAPDEQTTSDETSEQKTKNVILYQYRFNPSQLTILKGTEVTFENKDPDKHNVTISALNISEDLENGDTFSHTFDTLGEFAVNDRFSSTGMKMTIKVTDEDESGGSDSEGESGSTDGGG